MLDDIFIKNKYRKVKEKKHLWANQLPMAPHISISGRYSLTTSLSSTVRRWWCSSTHRALHIKQWRIQKNMQNQLINSLINSTPSRFTPNATFLTLLLVDRIPQLHRQAMLLLLPSCVLHVKQCRIQKNTWNQVIDSLINSTPRDSRPVRLFSWSRIHQPRI